MTKIRKKYLVRTQYNHSGKAIDTWNEVEEHIVKQTNKGHKGIVVYENVYQEIYLKGHKIVIDKRLKQ